MTAEPWTKDDPEFRQHQLSCFICNNNGQPAQSAYRPHTLDASCWCIANRALRPRCKLATEWNLAVKADDSSLMQAAGPPPSKPDPVEYSGPRRDDEVAKWLRRAREYYAEFAGYDAEARAAYHAIDGLLDSYRLHADTGTPLAEFVSEIQQPLVERMNPVGLRRVGTFRRLRHMPGLQ